MIHKIKKMMCPDNNPNISDAHLVKQVLDSLILKSDPYDEKLDIKNDTSVIKLFGARIATWSLAVIAWPLPSRRLKIATKRSN